MTLLVRPRWTFDQRREKAIAELLLKEKFFLLLPRQILVSVSAMFTLTSASPVGLVAVKSDTDLSVAETGYHHYPDYSAGHKHAAYGHHAGDHADHHGAAYGAKDHYADGAYGHNGHNHYNDYGSHGAHGGHYGNHHNGYGHGLYTRNRGYGFEKHYAYDKELATHKNSHDYGSNGASGGHYGNHGQNGECFKSGERVEEESSS